MLRCYLEVSKSKNDNDIQKFYDGVKREQPERDGMYILFTAKGTKCLVHGV